MVAAIAGVATVAAGAMSASAAGDAADAQSESAAQSNALQRYMYDNNVALNAPVMNTGNAARDRLSYLLGLSPTGFSGSARPKDTYDSLRQQLVGQYTRYGPAPGSGVFNADNLPINERIAYERIKHDPARRAAFEAERLGNPGSRPGTGSANDGVHADELVWGQPQNIGTLDESALDAEIKRRLAEQDAAAAAAEERARNDPNYGRLAQQFEFEKYVPKEFSYTGDDLYKDPSYLFRLQQGQKALDRQGAAAGRFLSGRQLQASSNYNQGAASQEFQNAYQRALGTFGTNEGNRFNAFTTNEGNRFNAYQANFSNAVNPLLSLAGSGQVSAQFIGNAGMQTGQNIGNTLMSNANAQGAAGIAGANAMSSGINNAVGGYQQNQLMNSLLNRGSVNNNPYTAGSTPAYGNNSLFGSGTGGMGD